MSMRDTNDLLRLQQTFEGMPEKWNRGNDKETIFEKKVDEFFDMEMDMSLETELNYHIRY